MSFSPSSDSEKTRMSGREIIAIKAEMKIVLNLVFAQTMREKRREEVFGSIKSKFMSCGDKRNTKSKIDFPFSA